MNKTKFIKLAQQWVAVSAMADKIEEIERVYGTYAEEFEDYAKMSTDAHAAAFSANLLAADIAVLAIEAANESPKPKGSVLPCCSLEQFEEFWKLYPRKKGKGAAKKKYRFIPEEKHKLILQSLRAHIKAWKGVEEQFIPHPTTWLNQERWEDEISGEKKEKYNFDAANNFNPYTA